MYMYTYMQMYMYIHMFWRPAPHGPPPHRVGSPPLGAQMALGLQWECIWRLRGHWDCSGSALGASDATGTAMGVPLAWLDVRHLLKS